MAEFTGRERQLESLTDELDRPGPSLIFWCQTLTFDIFSRDKSNKE